MYENQGEEENAKVAYELSLQFCTNKRQANEIYRKYIVPDCLEDIVEMLPESLVYHDELYELESEMAIMQSFEQWSKLTLGLKRFVKLVHEETFRNLHFVSSHHCNSLKTVLRPLNDSIINVINDYIFPL